MGYDEKDITAELSTTVSFGLKAPPFPHFPFFLSFRCFIYASFYISLSSPSSFLPSLKSPSEVKPPHKSCVVAVVGCRPELHSLFLPVCTGEQQSLSPPPLLPAPLLPSPFYVFPSYTLSLLRMGRKC